MASIHRGPHLADKGGAAVRPPGGVARWPSAWTRLAAHLDFATAADSQLPPCTRSLALACPRQTGSAGRVAAG